MIPAKVIPGSERRPRVMFFVPRYHTNMRYWLIGLRECGYVVDLWTLYQGAIENHDEFTPRVIGYSRIWRFLFRNRRLGQYDVFSMRFGVPSFRRLFSLFRRCNRPTIVIARDINTTAGFIVFIACRLFLRIPFIAYSQGAKYRKTLGRKHRAAYRVMFEMLGATGMTPVRGITEEGFTHDSIHYVPFAHTPMANELDVVSRRHDPVIILMVGKFVRRKNHALLIRAFAHLRRRSSINARLRLVGECVEPSQQQLLADLSALVGNEGVQDCVDFYINVPCREMDLLFRTSSIFVLPSRDEPASFSNLEAMAYGLPVFCTDANGTSCYVRPGITGEILTSDKEEALVDLLELWCGDRERLRKGGVAALRICREEHAPTRLANFVTSQLQMLPPD